MEKRIFLPLLMICLLSGACSKQNEEPLAYVLTAFSGDIAVSGDGRSALIKCDDLPHSYDINITGNFDRIEFDKRISWISVSFVASVIHIEIQGNPSESQARQAVLEFTVVRDGDSVSVSIAVNQREALSGKPVDPEKPDDGGFPVCPVSLDFNASEWEACGLTQSFAHCIFNKDKALPSCYSFRDYHATGLGGVVVLTTFDGQPKAYDVACPVECDSEVTVTVEAMTLVARCPVCGSCFDLFLGDGTPRQNCEAARRGLSMKRYTVGHGAGPYYHVSR